MTARKRRPRLQTWHVKVDVAFPSDHPMYPRHALTVRADVAAETATDAAETVLGIARAHWPREWKVEERA